MLMKRWRELPQWLRNDEVKKYYLILLRKQSDMRIKRMMDLVGALMLTVVLSPVMLITALLIKHDSRGPVFYRQERVTQYGKTYRIFKFRTMVTDADQKGPLVTAGADDRITKVGKTLRKYRIDEIPQLLNIITGDMSFVGTRPEVPKYVEQYTDEMKATLLLPAGITSRTSIEFKDEDALIEKYQKEEDLSVDEIYVQKILPVKMKHNLKYLEHFSVAGDIKIMIQTVLAVIR